MLDKLQQLKGEELASGLTDFRKCPHCGEVWYKKPERLGGMGCDGSTKCGNRMNALDIPEYGGLSFIFDVDMGTQKLCWKLRKSTPAISTSLQGRITTGRQEPRGCGKDITWSKMSCITSQELEQLKLQVSDLKGEIEVVDMGRGKTHRFKGYKQTPMRRSHMDEKFSRIQASVDSMDNYWPPCLDSSF
eukprot:TRINITY_DN58957_c0_g1_i1.p1 TRINITY_DN58957_c0_g1~~TRINITY_DN58957_c0_g1_i1.p1  ORF type:complete len:189 (-),score=24.58 TRINITY_DN58957_c0_g1_i1:312-878(-)